MVCVVVTGGLASGKSTLASYILKNYRIPLIDADDIVKTLYADHDVQAQFIDYFGNEVLRGSVLDTAFLRQRIFRSVEDRRYVEGVIHPKVRHKLMQFSAMHTRDYAIALVPLVYETESWRYYDATVVVDLPYNLQVARAQARGMSQVLVENILASQALREQRLSMADDILYNMRGLWFFYRQIDRMIVNHRQRFK